jgi:NAD(P)-dependent dehydrogenase (short-subunit alcohol dehydrogenase family)
MTGTAPSARLLEGRVAIVSGIGPGLGSDIARALAEHGARLALGARRDRFTKVLADELRTKGTEVVWRTTDIAVDDDCRALVDAAVDEFGTVDILVNNAAHGGAYAPLAGEAAAVIREVFEVNLVGTLQMTNAVLPVMRDRKSGRIVMIGSNVAESVVENFGVYGASKAALAHATRHLALELGPFGIRVNAVLPGAIWGRALERYFQDIARRRSIPFEQVFAEQSSTSALGYLPHSSEIAGTVVFLASELARPVTGQCIRVDSGQWLESRATAGDQT